MGHTPGPRDIFERLHHAVRDDYDMDSQADLYMDDGQLEWPFAPVGLPRLIQGREAIRSTLSAAGRRSRQLGRRILRYDSMVIHETTDPEVIVAEFTLIGEIASSSDRYELPFIQVLRVRDGRIVSMRDYFNPQALTAMLNVTST